MRRYLLPLAAIALVPVPAAAAKTDAPATAAAEPNAKDGNKKICKTAKVTGSRLASNRSCMTRAEWAELEERTFKELQSAQARAQISAARGEAGVK
jgi:hypothetical protein